MLKLTHNDKTLNVKFLKIVTATCDRLPQTGKKCEINIGHTNHNNLFIKNIRFKHQHLIRDIELDIQGRQATKLYNQVDGTFDVIRYVLGILDNTILPFGCVTNDNYFPLLLNGSIRLRILFKNLDECNIDFQELSKITYELYESDNVVDTLKFMAPCMQFTGLESFMFQYAKYKMDYNGIVTHLIFSLPSDPIYELKEVSIMLIDSLKNHIPITPVLERFGDFYIIPLVKSLNLDIVDINEMGIDFNIVDHAQINVSLKNNINPQMFIENGMIDTSKCYYNIFALSYVDYKVNDGKFDMHKA